MIYIDTSVLAPLYIPEAASQRAGEHIARNSPAYISLLVEVEMASLVSRRLREKELDRSMADTIIGAFESHLTQGVYRKVDLTFDEYRRAYSWIRRFDTSLRTLDGLHLAAAASHDLRVVTADRSMFKSARSIGIDVELLAT